MLWKASGPLDLTKPYTCRAFGVGFSLFPALTLTHSTFCDGLSGLYGLPSPPAYVHMRNMRAPFKGY